MFYCDECAKKKNWNMTFFKSIGLCEVCGKKRECSDLPSKDLTKEPTFPEQKKIEKKGN